MSHVPTVFSLKHRLGQIGLREMAYSRTKSIGYMPVHTHIFSSITGNPWMDDVTSTILEPLEFTKLSNSHLNHSSKVGFTSFINSNAMNLCLSHTEDGEIVSVTIQYLGD